MIAFTSSPKAFLISDISSSIYFGISLIGLLSLYLLSSLGGKNPKAVYAGLGYPPGTYTQDALLDAIVLDLEQTFNKSSVLVDENIGSEEDTFENIDNTAGQGGYLS